MVRPFKRRPDMRLIRAGRGSRNGLRPQVQKANSDAPPVPAHSWKTVAQHRSRETGVRKPPLTTSLQAGLTPICPDPATASPNFFPCGFAAFLARQQVRLSPPCA